MKFLLNRFIVPCLCACLLAGCADRAEPRYPLPVEPLELVLDEDAFHEFARPVLADVERGLARQPPPELARLKLLLSIRVHLAHDARDDEAALAAAARIRELQTNPADKAFAGLTTQAAVAARRATGASTASPAYLQAFARELAAQLDSLPRSPDIRSMLEQQRAKIDAITRENLLREVREKIAPAIAERGYCDLELADQLVRVYHRLTSIVPAREVTLQALDAAIAAQPIS